MRSGAPQAREKLFRKYGSKVDAAIVDRGDVLEGSGVNLRSAILHA
jgi:hypothetical protein